MSDRFAIEITSAEARQLRGSLTPAQELELRSLEERCLPQFRAQLVAEGWSASQVEEREVSLAVLLLLRVARPELAIPLPRYATLH